MRAKPGVADAPMREGRSLVAMRSLGERRHSSSSEVGRLVPTMVRECLREMVGEETPVAAASTRKIIKDSGGSRLSRN